jgi:hypothetical protein
MIERYATCENWANYFEKREGVKVSIATIRRRVKDAGKIGQDGRSKLDRLYMGAFFSEKDVRGACADLLQPISKVDESGFLVLGGVCYGTVYSLSDQLGVSVQSITRRLASSAIGSILGKDRNGDLANLYSRVAVQELFAENLDPNLLRCGGDGFAVASGTRYGIISSLASILGISQRAITLRLASSGLKPVRGKNKHGQLVDLYSEAAIRELFADLLDVSLPRCGEDGSVMVSEIRYGTLKSLSRLIGISVGAIASRLKSSGLVPILGKGKNGIIDLWSEPAVRSACADTLRPMPKVDESGFFIQNGIRYGTIGAWMRELGISEGAIGIRLRSASAHSLRGKNSNGQMRDFYSESAVREACSDLLLPMPHADENGFLVLDDIRYGNIRALARVFGVSDNFILSRLNSSRVAPIRGKSKGGQTYDFYPEPAVRELCADLLDPNLPHCGKEGFAMIDSVRHGPINSFARLLGLNPKTISLRISLSNIASVRGKDKMGHLVGLYSEFAVRELCKDLLEKKVKKSNPKPR